MKIVQINVVPYGSTGNIAKGIKETAIKNGIECKFAYSWTKKERGLQNDDDILIGGFFSKIFHMVIARLFGGCGLFSYFATRKLVRRLKEYQPDLIHIHIIHSWYINIPQLFKYINRYSIPTVWTMHDCWAFTGHCPHFVMEKCEKWKRGCKKCSIHNEYPQSIIDDSRWMWKKKMNWFTNVKDMTIVTPSEWLAELVKQSFLQEYPIKVINNGINLDIFKLRNTGIRERFSIDNSKYVVLGVAMDWGKRKGLDVFVKIADLLPKEKYQIVLVGVASEVQKNLPEEIICINKTYDQVELSELYSTADVFFNPTREDNYPTVNMEAIACGTPVITFKTGGSPEMLNDEIGVILENNTVECALEAIISVCETNPIDRNACIKHAKQFDNRARYLEYVNLYKEMLRTKDDA